jgi:hypothetical protein
LPATARKPLINMMSSRVEGRCMTNDADPWPRCPRCRYPINHPDGGTVRAGFYELLRFGPPDGWSLVGVRVLRCGACRALWPLPETAVALNEDEVRARIGLAGKEV